METKHFLSSIIDISSLKHKQTKTNSDYILSILEICINSTKYNLPTSNTSRNFWEEVLKNKTLNELFILFKSETLRKYWRIIRDLNQNEKLIRTVHQNSSIINNPQFKLLSIIKIIATYLKTNPHNTFSSYLYNNTTLLNNNNNTINIHNHIEQSILNKTDINIDDIVDVLNLYFPFQTKDEIYTILYQTSCNIHNAYLYLVNRDKYNKYIFTETDDYIITHMKGDNNNNKYYSLLVDTKGEELVKERERFLAIN